MFPMEYYKFYSHHTKKERKKMNKILLIILLAFIFSQARFWDSYTSMDCETSYTFSQDSLVQIKSAQNNQNALLSIKCIESGYDDIIPITDSVGNIINWEEKHISVIGYSVHFYNELKQAEDSLWARHLNFFNTEETFDTTDAKNYILFNNDSISFDSIYNKELHSSGNFLILYKGKNYNAFCHIMSGLCTGKYSISCQYQDEGSLNFDPISQIPSDCDYLDKITPARHGKIKTSRKHSAYKANGTSAPETSSNVIIKNKQPTLQLKGGH